MTTTITAAMVAQLRAATDFPMMDCKRALVAAEGDEVRAAEILRMSRPPFEALRGITRTQLDLLLTYIDLKTQKMVHPQQHITFLDAFRAEERATSVRKQLIETTRSY